jgi:hypothetical protein
VDSRLHLVVVAVLGVVLSATALVEAANGGHPEFGQEKLELETVPPNPGTLVNRTPQELIHEFPQLEGLEPAVDQKDLPMILQKAGENVAAYFHNFVSTSATEDVLQQRLRPDGKVQGSLKQRFQYLLVAPPGKGEVEVQEYRMNKKGRPAHQKVLWGGVLTLRFASMPAHFHPSLQEQSRYSYLGKQKIDGHDTCVVAFAQNPIAARYQEKLVRLSGTYVIFLEGIAWIDSATFQIIRLHTEMLPGQSVESLQSQTTDIKFDEVQFEGIPVKFWLPKEVVVSDQWADCSLRNVHAYSDYKLYASQTKIISDGVTP